MVLSNDHGEGDCCGTTIRHDRREQHQQDAHDGFGIISRCESLLSSLPGPGEIGHGLIDCLATERAQRGIVTLDLARLDSSIAPLVDREITGSILDRPLLERVLAE